MGVMKPCSGAAKGHVGNGEGRCSLGVSCTPIAESTLGEEYHCNFPHKYSYNRTLNTSKRSTRHDQCAFSS